MKTIIPMLGTFEEEFGRWGKFLQTLNGISLIECVLNNLKTWIEFDFVFVISEADKKRHLDSVLKLFCPDCEIVISKGQTNGALCSVLLASEYFGDDDLLIANADQIVNFDGKIWLEYLRKKKAKAGTVIFDSVHPRWSSVRLDDDGFVIEASEKNPISSHATAGLYWFSDAQEFFELSSRMISNGDDTEGAYFVCPILNEYVLEGHEVYAFEIDPCQYISLSSSVDFEAYRRELLR